MSRQVAQDEGREKSKEKSKSKEKGKEKSKEKILALLSENPHATTADLLVETGLSASGVEKNIRELKAAGRLRRIGPDKGGHWEVVGDGIDV
jgi:ATP-dependent DNA helicase RecG